MIRTCKQLLLFSLLIYLAGCTTTIKHQLNFDPTEPIRVAVLPFEPPDGQQADDKADLAVDDVSLISRALSEDPQEIVRKQVLSSLSKSNLDLVSTTLIDIDLPHHGFALENGKIDLKKVYQTNPSQLCTQFLNCDAILYGKVVEWDRSYYGIQSVATVGIELKLVGASDNRVLFEASAKDYESRGISKIPTGFSDLVIEPVKGLDSDIITALSHNLVSQMLRPLVVASDERLLKEPPPSILAASHDLREGERISESRPLVVLMYGTPGLIASFSIGVDIQDLPMIERSPGHYYGEYHPVGAPMVENKTVVVKLSDRLGRTTTQPILIRPLKG